MTQTPESSSPSAEDARFVAELAWKMLDNCLEEDEAEQLDLLLTHSESARQTYVQVVQMHVDLLDHYGALPSGEEFIKKALAAKAASPPAPAKTAAAAAAPSASPAPPPADEIAATERTGA